MAAAATFRTDARKVLIADSKDAIRRPPTVGDGRSTDSLAHARLGEGRQLDLGHFWEGKASYRQAGVWVFRLSVTNTITLASGYASSPARWLRVVLLPSDVVCRSELLTCPHGRISPSVVWQPRRPHRRC